jgi:hypothetical protein
MFRYWLALLPVVLAGAEIVSFPSGERTLRGVLYKPEGPGPFPAVLFNHGSEKGHDNQFDALGAYSGPSRSRFRDDDDQDSGIMPIRIPG